MSSPSHPQSPQTGLRHPDLEALDTHLRQIGLVRSISAVLGWDEQTYMPPGAAEYRGEQAALLARQAHQLLTGDDLGRLLDRARAVQGLEKNQAVQIREVQRERNRALALSEEYVGRLSRVTTAAFHAWQKARADERFSDFLPHLEEVLRLKREEASLVAPVLRPGQTLGAYEALLDEYEPGLEVSAVHKLFSELRAPLTQLVLEADGRRREDRPRPLQGRFPVESQRQILEELMTAIGMSGEAGRLDTSTHPFCTRLGPRDTRITTRYDEADFGDALFSVLHEAGHALYEQGLPEEYYGTPLGDSVSLGIHESQSRLWENFVGRCEPFWRWFLPRVQAHFPGAGSGCDFQDWMESVHEVRRSYIRVDADEVTYNLHVLLRFELESQLVAGGLEARDLPEAWNGLQQELLGLPPQGDRLGCLQDVHWSGGAFGYFPTYTLGNVQAACLMEAIRKSLPNLDEDLATGQFGGILEWLRDRVHRPGRLLSSQELMGIATGEPVTATPLLRHLEQKVQRYC